MSYVVLDSVDLRVNVKAAKSKLREYIDSQCSRPFVYEKVGGLFSFGRTKRVFIEITPKHLQSNFEYYTQYMQPYIKVKKCLDRLLCCCDSAKQVSVSSEDLLILSKCLRGVYEC